VSVPNADAIKGSLAQAQVAGIPIITLNSGFDDYKAPGRDHARRPDGGHRGQAAA
jgi:simple sugar transport system substrate-binding protein